MTITLRDTWEIQNLNDYKVHFARWDGNDQPLEVWARSRDAWRAWQEYWPGRNDFNRPRIFALMQFYHEMDAWLFGGVFEVLERLPEAYRVELTDERANLIGRLKLGTPYRERTTRVKLENHYDDFEVLEVLREPYAGTAFPGYSRIDLSFAELETIVENERADWRAALQSVSGIYGIMDTRVDRLYVGAAIGGGGVWSRWAEYVASGDGGNAALREIIGEHRLEYCREHFRFTLLEPLLQTTSREAVTAREVHWKQVLRTRGARGFNRN